MSVLAWCWRCEKVVAMLDEVEWQRMEPLLQEDLREIKQYRSDTGAPLDEALRQPHGLAALAEYRAVTGVEETRVDAIRHHRRSLHGPECPTCGRPLRTPQASYCLPCHAEAVRAAGTAE
ncbi:hypothetical protein [Tahibacter caeni]|uniref:hypothetical protein n=1 Tax=Tahibacter caeni TaxID=1453545 RepID=UPI0021495EAF|nr:hypothetical protein [Tahibacter caeni]